MSTKVYNGGQWHQADNAVVDSYGKSEADLLFALKSNTYAKSETYSKTEADAKYLPLSGGTMTGQIVARQGSDGFIKAPDNNNVTAYFGGVDILGGASLWLNGLNRSGDNAGCFMLGASTGTTFNWFRGTPTGELTWMNNKVCTQKSGSMNFSLESGFSVTSINAVQFAPNLYYVMFVITYTSAITTTYKKLSSNGITIDGLSPAKNQVLAGAAHTDGATVTLVKNSSGNWWIGCPSKTIAANEKIYFSGVLCV